MINYDQYSEPIASDDGWDIAIEESLHTEAQR